MQATYEKGILNAKCLVQGWLTNRAVAIWVVSILAVILRIGVSLALKTYEFDAAKDHWEFGFEWGRIAKWLVLRGSFSLDGEGPTADTDPLYSFIIAPFFYAFGVYTTAAAIALVVFQSLLCGLSAWAIFVLAERLYGPFEARLSALLFALYPPSVFFAIGRVGPSSLAIGLLCLVFLLAGRLRSSRRLADAVLTGILIGLTVLTSSDNLSLFLVIPLWLFLTGAGQRGRMILKGSVVVATALLVLLPWSLRNSAVSGEPTISKANLGYHLWAGNNPNATGYFFTSRPPDLVVGREQQQQSRYYAMAFSWIAEHPGEFLKLTLKRMQYFWYVIDGRGYSRNEVLQGWLLLTLIMLATLGLFWRAQSWERASLLWLFIAIYPLVFYFTHASFYRHRYHIEPFVLILASHGIRCLWAAFANRGAREAVKVYSASPE